MANHPISGIYDEIDSCYLNKPWMTDLSSNSYQGLGPAKKCKDKIEENRNQRQKRSRSHCVLSAVATLFVGIGIGFAIGWMLFGYYKLDVHNALTPEYPRNYGYSDSTITFTTLRDDFATEKMVATTQNEPNIPKIVIQDNNDGEHEENSGQADVEFEEDTPENTNLFSIDNDESNNCTCAMADVCPVANKGQLLLDNTCTTKEREYWSLNDNSMICQPDEAGWLTWLRRVDATVLFNRTWEEYVTGFGDPSGNYWLGLDRLTHITGHEQRYVMRVEIESWNGTIESAEYGTFSVGDKYTGYRLNIGNYFGTGNDAFYDGNPRWRLHGQQFSTWDRDSDNNARNCALWQASGGGWWYNDCANVHPTAKYGPNQERNMGYLMWWRAFDSRTYPPIKRIAMKLRVKVN